MYILAVYSVISYYTGVGEEKGTRETKYNVNGAQNIRDIRAPSGIHQLVLSYGRYAACSGLRRSS